VNKGYHGLIERLKEMPSEWTLIQITKNYNPKDIVTPRPTDKPTEVGELFISRYQCGQKYKNMYVILNLFGIFICLFLLIIIYVILSKPLTIKVEKAKSSLGQKTIFEVLKKSLEDTNDRQNKDPVAIRNLRDSASQSIKVNTQLYLMKYF